ncbi:MAG TPA: hypothetical protein VLB44_16995 [Kofleriaceae bacterium]|nr:hypothetical protein [Kofleriaceae bacterium]
MRWLFILLTLGACESRYGTYFTIDGEGNEIHFDHVRLYFGSSTDGTAIGKPSGATTGKVYLQQFDPSDEFDVPKVGDGSHATQTTYWLPYAHENMSLAYVAAVAFDADKPVGIGEVIGFKLEPDVVDTYDVELQPATFGVDLWGSDPGCLAWTRQRDGTFTTVAVLPANDSDCDGIVASADCNDLCPPDTRSCSPDLSVCGTADTCGLACAKQNSCTITVCMPDTACSSTCALTAATLDARLGCAIDHTVNHIQINVDVMQDQPCANQFVFTPYGRPCINPRIEWADPRLDDWKFQISANGTTDCQLQMESASNAPFVGDHHVIVSFDPLPGQSSRWSAIVGVQPGITQCTTEGYQVVNPEAGAPYECP